MEIIFYAGSLRPGGGLTVAKMMIEAIAENNANNIRVYTGAKDSSKSLQVVFDSYENVTEIQFFHGVNAEIRYALSKIFFLAKSVFNRKVLLISVNYYIPTFYTLFVYHLNLLSFLQQDSGNLSFKVKQFDAKLACKYANINVFESYYLKDTASKYTNIIIKNPDVLYIGVDPSFTVPSSIVEVDAKPNILLVSSMQPHKDNETCVKVLAKLVSAKPQFSWVLNIAGGQTMGQWHPLLEFADSLDVADKIRIHGPLSKEKLSSMMNNSLCLISASRIESFCMVALEAMAAGCPVIVTNETSMPESVASAAIIVEAGAIDQFTQAILLLYADNCVREKYIEKGTEHIKAFTHDIFKETLLEIINKNIKSAQ